MSINWRPISWWALFAPLMRFLLGRRRVVTNQAEFQHALDTVKNWDTIEVAKGTVLEDGCRTERTLTGVHIRGQKRP